MTYAVSSALQQAVYQTLSGDAGLAAIVGANIFDVAPSGSVPAIYVLMALSACATGPIKPDMVRPTI